MAANPALGLDDRDESGLKREVLEILKATLLSDGNVSASSMAADLWALTEQTSEQTSQPWPLLTKDFFIPIHAIACHLPHQGLLLDALVALLRELKHLSFIRDGHQEERLYAWVEQSSMEAAFAEVYDKLIYTKVPDLSADDDAARRINFHSYAARLTEAGLLLNDKYCIYAFADALEGQYSERMMPESEDDPPMLQDVALRVTIVTEWIRHAAQTIYRKEFSVWGEVHGPLVTWEEDGFSENRWKLWKSRLSMVEMTAIVDEETRIRAAEAVRKMNEIEDTARGKLNLVNC